MSDNNKNNTFATSSTPPPPNNPPPLTKSQKGRFKKLKKRAFSSLQQPCATSGYHGITSFADTKELNDLMHKSNTNSGHCLMAGPSILFAKPARDGGKEKKRRRVCEGVDLRDLLTHLLFYSDTNNNSYNKNDGNDASASATKKSKKRRNPSSETMDKRKWVRDRIAANIPPWSMIHNPACCTNVAVIEFALEHSSSSSAGEDSIVEKVPILASLLNTNELQQKKKEEEQEKKEVNTQGTPPQLSLTKQQKQQPKNPSSSSSSSQRDETNHRSAIQLHTRLFQGLYPRSISDILLYLDPPSPTPTPPSQSNKKQKKVVVTSTINVANDDDNDDEVEHIKELLVKKKELWKENYPFLRLKSKHDCGGEKSEKDDTHDGKRIKMKERLAECKMQLQNYWKEQKEKEYHENSSSSKRVKEEEDEEVAIPPLLPLDQAQDIVNAMGVDVSFHSDNSTTPTTSSSSSSSLSDNDNKVDNRKYVQTFQSNPSSSSSSHYNIYALDCEMVKTTMGIELARVTLLQYKKGNDKRGEEYRVLLDTLVKPDNVVLDYLTEYSGMTPQMLNPITTRLPQIQCLLLSTLQKEDVLIGHSLENDLKALRLVHDVIIDTAILFRGRNGRKYSLRHLSSALLKRNIQSNQTTASHISERKEKQQQQGHCSEEDAAAALTLALRRCRQGESFCLKEQLNRINILELVCSARRRYANCPSLFPVITGGDEQKQGPLVCIGPKDWIQKYVTSSNNNAHALTCENIMDGTMVKGIASWLKREGRKANLLWSKLAVNVDEKRDVDSGRYKRINDVLSDLIAQIPVTTSILLVFQHDHQKAAKLTQQRKACKDPRSTLGWTDIQEEEWIEAVDRCRSCDAFWVGMSP